MAAPVPSAPAAAAIGFFPFTKMVLAAFDAEGAAIDQRRGNLFSGVVIDKLHRSTRDFHVPAAFFLRESFEIDETYGFVFVHGNNYGFSRIFLILNRNKPVVFRQTANLFALHRSGHSLTSLKYIIAWLLTYVNNIGNN